jgi:addiction module RelE/StbE family toxin
LKLVWTRTAVVERKKIRVTIAQDDPAAALALDALFSEKAGRLVGHSALGWLGRVAGTRELVVRQNDVLVYDENGDSVRVQRVLHAARQLPPRR